MTNQLQNHSWPGWKTVRPIGRGGFGTVYEIERELFDYTEKAALKVISIPQHGSDIDELISDGYDRESITSTLRNHLKSILAEYALMRKMNGHSNIVHCDDVDYTPHEDGIGWDIYIKMELLTPLTKALPQTIPEETVVKVARDMCAALELCRKHEIIHRDIKPQNIFVSDSGEYKLGDFGIAKSVEKTMGGTKIGTYKYMAPEVYHNKPYGSAADIYSLGLVLYWMLNERRMPFMPLPPEKLTSDLDSIARRNRLHGKPLPAPAHGSPQLQRIVLKACAFDPADRYLTAGDMLKDLEMLGSGTAVPAYQANSDGHKPPSIASTPVGSAVQKTEAAPPLIAASPPPDSTDPFQNTLLPDNRTMVRGAMPLEDVSTLTDTDAVTAILPPSDRARRHRSDSQRTTKKNQQRKSNTGWIKWAILCVAVVILLLFLRSCLSGEASVPPGETTTPETTLPPETTTPQLVLQGMGEWSDWVESLPEDVTAETHVIQEMPLYRCRTLETQTSTEETSIEGWEFVETKEEPGAFGDWSKWSTEAVTASDTRQVESETRYRYRTKETATSSSSSKSGWTHYDTTYTKGDFGSWSEWSTTAVTASSTVDVEKKTQYRYRDKETTTSSASSLSGWTQYDSTYEWGEYGAWSDWSDTPVSSTDSREVRTRQVEESGASTKYTYGAYFSNDSTKPSSFSHFCSTCAAEQYGGTWTYRTYTQRNAAAKSSMSVSCPHKGTISSQYFAEDGRIYYSEQVSTEGSSYKTQYSYRTREKVYTYYYYRWSAWSSFSDTKVSETDKRDVETQTLYRSRKCTQETTYHFYRWSDWSSWSTKEVKKSDSREVEKQVYYRYRDCPMLKVHYFRRWTDWSDYDSQVPVPSETLQVEGKLLLRYASRPTDGNEDQVQLRYSDVPEGSPVYDAVNWAGNLGIMPGTGSDTFTPDGNCTKKQVIIMLWRTMGYPEPEQTQSPFTDITNADPYWKAVVWAIEAGIATGESEDFFGADNFCTRAQMITFLYRASGSPEVMLAQEPFEDVDQDMFFYNAVLWAYEHNISSGVSTTVFGVNDLCSRGQAAVLFYRTFRNNLP